MEEEDVVPDEASVGSFQCDGRTFVIRSESFQHQNRLVVFRWLHQ